MTHASTHALTHTYSEMQSKVRKMFNDWCIENQRPFCFKDFPNLSKYNFRYFVSKLKDSLEIAITGHPTFYKIKGMKLTPLTLEPTWVQPNRTQLESIIDDLNIKDPAIHDLKLSIPNTSLHTKLLLQGATPNPKNNLIKVNYDVDTNITTKILVYPKTIQICLGCTKTPIIYDTEGIFQLFGHLAGIYHHLTILTKTELPQWYTWRITQYHFGKDGGVRLTGHSWSMDIKEFGVGEFRVYAKQFSNDKTVLRGEQIRSPQIPIKDLIHEVLH